ncbi:MAG: class I SAM-dependent methyltransferase [Thermoanaerobaculia bacterium]
MTFPELVCPVHASQLASSATALRCPQNHEYPVTRAIPRVLESSTEYADAFGEQWNTYRVTQLDSYTSTTISRDRLVRCVGPDVWSALHGSAALNVLETGCGAGRFTEVLLECPAAVVTSIDFSTAVDANEVNCPQSDRHRILQCDINALPFPREAFDVVICLGVIQHTPNPEQTIGSLYEATKPGGWLVIDHYRPSFSHYTKVTALVLRPILKRLPPRQGRVATDWITRLFFPLHRAVKRHRLLQMILSRVSPLLTYFQTYPQLNDQLHYEWALLDTHDHLTDYYKHLRTVPQIERVLRGLGATDIWVAKGGNGVEARCRKPPR